MTEIQFIHLLRRSFPTPFCLSFARRSRKEMHARVIRDGSICAKNSTFGYFDGTNPITGKGIQFTVAFKSVNYFFAC